MKGLPSAVRLLAIPLVLAAYIGILAYNARESERRSLKLHGEVSDAASVHVSLKILSVDLERAEVTVRIAFQIEGALAEDQITPSTDLKFLMNSVRGPQEYQFRRGERMTPIEAVFFIEGEVHKYPFDTHRTDFSMLIMKPAARTPPSTDPPATPKTTKGPKARLQRIPAASAESEVLAGTAAMVKNVPVPISWDMLASAPGIHFSKDENVPNTRRGGVIRIPLILSRARNVIGVSIGAQLIMMSLALSLLAMVVFGTIQAGEAVALPLSVAVTLIFGLPALRAIQPGVPLVGAFSDYVSFLPAEYIVAVSNIIVIWTWIFRHRQAKPPVSGG